MENIFNEKKVEIKEEINNQYTEFFKKVQYQEDFDKLIKNSNKLSEEITNKFNKKYFNNLEESKKNEIIKFDK